MDLNEEMSSHYPMNEKIPNTISNGDDSDEDEKEDNLNANPKLHSFTDCTEQNKKVFTNDLK